ncbi:MAG: hypothetical protein V1755_15965 [Chloroflexota bacterium]
MNNAVRTTLIVVLVLVLGAGLFYGGMYYAGRRYSPWGPGMMGGLGPSGMMGGFGYSGPGNSAYGPGMMGGYGGMMGGYSGMMGGGGMMGGYGFNSAYGVEPLTVDQANSAVQTYLDGLQNDDLALEEIMIFDNHAYAIVVEKSTSTGAFELLVDPVNQSVFPEYGPNMMWNLKYGMMSGFGGYGMMGPGMMGGGYGYGPGGMMGASGSNNGAAVPQISADMPVLPEQAAQAAQEYLDLALPGAVATEEVTPFYGYYTIDIARDRNIVGMLSVNGYTKQVFLHTWHGDFIAMSEQ